MTAETTSGGSESCQGAVKRRGVNWTPMTSWIQVVDTTVDSSVHTTADSSVHTTVDSSVPSCEPVAGASCSSADSCSSVTIRGALMSHHLGGEVLHRGGGVTFEHRQPLRIGGELTLFRQNTPIWTQGTLRVMLRLVLI